jgi:uncharacterized protein RhaS with RHS repeats
MWYYKARVYSPTLGRFLQVDPIGYDDGLNWYNYVGGDPVNFVDPFGLDGEEADIVVRGPRTRSVGSPFATISIGGGDFGGGPMFNFPPGMGQYDVIADADIVVNAVKPKPNRVILPTRRQIADAQAQVCSDPRIQAALKDPAVQGAIKDAMKKTSSTGKEHAFEYGTGIFGGNGVTSVYGGSATEVKLQSAFSALLDGVRYRTISFHTHPNEKNGSPPERGLSYDNPGANDTTLVSNGWIVVAITPSGEMFCGVPGK